jgi:ABC-type multidrug transport system ATPase subunit
LQLGNRRHHSTDEQKQSARAFAPRPYNGRRFLRANRNIKPPIAHLDTAPDAVVFQSVTKVFKPRPGLFGWFADERKHPIVALRDVSFRVPAGNVLVLLGPNGSGKTTLLRLISTMLLPDRGQILVQGADTQRASRQVRARVGFAVASERSFFPRLTAKENLDFFSALDDVPRKSRPQRIAMMLARNGLLDYANNQVMNFSAGMYQKLAIARALMKQAAVLLLDEPTRSLDPASTREIWRLICELSQWGTTVVIASHNFAEVAAVADSVALLQQGELKSQNKIAGFNSEQIRQLYFDKITQEEACQPELLLETCR